MVSIKTLGRFGPAAHAATPALIEALADEYLRQEAAIALGKIGPAAHAAVAALRPLQEESLVGHFARRALEEIDGG